MKSQELTPREIIFGNPDKAVPLISPDGKRMSYLAPVNNVLNVWVGTIGENNFRPITKDTDRGITRSGGKDNQHILYLQDAGGNENWRLFSVEAEDSKKLAGFEV